MSAPTTVSRQACPHCGAVPTPGAQFCTTCGKSLSTPAAPRGRWNRRFRLRGDASDLPYVMVAAALAIVLSYIPVISAAIYPFRLFGTFVHEWCHALVAIFTGGSVVQLQINADLSGETFTRGGWALPIFSAGYVGAAIAGALLLLAPTRFANRTLIGIGVLSLLMPFIGALSFGTSFPANTWVWTLLFGAVTLAVGLRAPRRWAGLFQQFVAIELCFTALDSLRTLVWLSIHAPSTATDALNADRYTHLPALFWSILWSLVAVAAILVAASRVVRRAIV